MQAITVENLSKLYYLGQAKRHNSVRDLLTSFARNPGLAHPKKRELWALRDINLEVRDGERVGIIGQNGAGKSTLLKIFSRITKPTSGRARIFGRVGSLLEVGTGFHSELSGRENIFMSGAIMGMKRREIKQRFDEIVAFAETEEFLDTPVKHYSSGMYMRLAFAVAAHLEPEILIVDEVLAVGDIAFQKKCLNKMRDVSQSGRTVLFVSHDMSAIARICERAIALNHGKVVSEGAANDVISEYLSASWGASAERNFAVEAEQYKNENVRLKKVRIVDGDGKPGAALDIRHRIGIEATYEVLRPGQIILPCFQVYNQGRVHIFTIQDVSDEWKRREKEKGEYTSTAWIPGNLMSEGNFMVNVAMVTYLPKMTVHFNALDAVSFSVFDPMTGDTARGDFAGNMEGAVRPIAEWETIVRS